MFSLIFINVLCIMLMVLPGVAARRKGWLGALSTTELSQMVIRFVYPCLIFTAIFERYSLDRLASDWQLPAYSLLIMVSGYIIGILVSTPLRFASSSEKKAFLFQCLMNNYSFLPLPLVLALYGKDGVAALLFSTLGAEIALWTLGIFALTGHEFRIKDLKHLLSPPLAAMYLAIALRATLDSLGLYERIFSDEFGIINQLLNTAKNFGLATIPLSMIIAGSRIGALETHHGFRNGKVWIVTALRLAVIPLAFAALLWFLPGSHEIKRIITVISVMPVAIASFMFSELYGGDKELVTCTVLSTHVVSLASIPALLPLLLSLYK